MGMWPGANLVFGIDLRNVSWSDEIEEKLYEEDGDPVESLMRILEEADGVEFPDDEWICAGEHLAESRNLTVVNCQSGDADYHMILAVSSANFSVSGWGDYKRLRIEQPDGQDLENIRWAIGVLGVSPEIADPSWMLFSSFS